MPVADAALQEQPFLAFRACPDCGGSSDAQGTMRAVHPAETLEFPKIREAWRGFFREPCFFTYARCTSCKQLFAPSYLTADAMQELYSEMDDNVYAGDYLAHLAQQQYCTTVARFLPQTRTYCEIGPDVGLFLKAARQRYPIQEVTLVEPNRAVWSRLKEAASGISCTIAPTIEEVPDSVKDGSVDMIVAVHVLDHLLAPADTLQWVLRKLSPKGVAVFIVHNERSLLARLMGRMWPAYCMQHPQLYNPTTLKDSLARQGFQVRQVIRTSNYFTLGYLVTHALYAVTKKHYAIDWLSWPVRIRLGNIMAIASR